MYYPIIDKLKEVMARTDEGGSAPLIVEGVLTSETNGTWIGNLLDIQSSIENNIPVYVKLQHNEVTLFLLINTIVPNIQAMASFGNNFFILHSDNTITTRST